MWRETIKLRLAWSLLFILGGKFSAVVNHYAVEHDLQKYSRALCASVPLLYWKIMGLYPIKNCIKSLKYYMHFTGISLIRLFCMCRCWQHREEGSCDRLLAVNLLHGCSRKHTVRVVQYFPMKPPTAFWHFPRTGEVKCPSWRWSSHSETHKRCNNIRKSVTCSWCEHR